MGMSLKKELSIVFILLLTALVVVLWVMNAFFLEKFYLKGKEEKLTEVYEVLKEEYEAGNVGSEDFNNTMQHLCNTNNMDFVISDSESNTIYTTINNASPMLRELRDMLFGRRRPGERIILEEDNYTISYMTDHFTDSEFITIWGSLDEENFFMVRTPVEGVRESVRVSNRFLLYVGVAALVLGAIVVWVASKKITDPIKELGEISKGVSSLDFEKRYKGGGTLEIEELGANINIMSEKLEQTISDLKSANLELKKDVEERNRADERRSEFIANVSHELKTPIALIQGYAEGLKEGVIDDSESRDYYCDVIMDEASKMDILVKRLILLNQVESGAGAMVMERFELNEMIKGGIASFEVMLRDAGIKVDYEPGDDVFVWGDVYQVEEVFRNYLSNAIHYCNDRKTISVRIETKDMKAKVLVFNYGDPVPDEILPRLWEKFYKADRSRSREYGGSGLGLSIVKAIMEAMNGGYGVNNYDDGVEFWFELEMR